MPRDYRLQLDDILESIQRIRLYASGISYDAFSDDTKTQDAIVRNLEVIGEAARALPPEVRQQAPSVEWSKIIGLRNVLIHAYFGISLPIIWDIVTTKLEDLEVACKTLLDKSQ